MGYSVAGRLEMPYLVVVETKRGVENQNPIFQLYAQLLAAARLNWEGDSLQDSKAERRAEKYCGETGLGDACEMS